MLNAMVPGKAAPAVNLSFVLPVATRNPFSGHLIERLRSTFGLFVLCVVILMVLLVLEKSTPASGVANACCCEKAKPEASKADAIDNFGSIINPPYL